MFSMNMIIGLKRDNYTNIEKEFVRKGIHMTIAVIPTLAAVNTLLTTLLLLSGIMFYLISELFRIQGRPVSGFISTITSIASRDRDKGITLGPLTLALGALLVLTSFNPIAASCGIYALAFGDGLSSVTGKLWGRVKIPFTGGKSVVGSITCFFMIFVTTFIITNSIEKSLLAGVAGAVTELIPVKDVDNLLIPIVVAVVVSL